MNMTVPKWSYHAEAQVRDLARALPVVREAVEQLEWLLLLADQGFLKQPPGLKPGVWDQHLDRMRDVVKELK
jgi:hypothetical protein